VSAFFKIDMIKPITRKEILITYLASCGATMIDRIDCTAEKKSSIKFNPCSHPPEGSLHASLICCGCSFFDSSFVAGS